MQISNQEMDETIEEEMSQDMEKGFSVLGTAFGVFNLNWGDLPLRLFWGLPLFWHLQMVRLSSRFG